MYIDVQFSILKNKEHKMSKIVIEIETTEDALRAQIVISAILGELVSGTDMSKETVAEEPKKEVAKKTTTPRKEVEKKPVTKKEVEPEPEADPKEDDELDDELGLEDEIDLTTLTAIAKDAVSKSDRATVKDVIGKYADKLSSVKPHDYAALAEDLEAL
jgi:hypothetical protein